ncbi:WD40 repeat-like protein [Thelephora ganbajun]|uniref:WD40 repeat-like protein n=1 Tax=Thelephora ganbajun TaxID=370292 RepID=A0ACB6Z6J2_THEGA|nr:WD40 repeat-like protein [Thelephora ganbajun]
MTPPELKLSIRTPAPVSALAFGKGNHLVIGADDGSLRLYNLPETKVYKAVRGLGSDVSSIAWMHSPGTEIGNIWVAAGQKVILLFGLDTPTMIQDASHSLVSLNNIIGPDDVFNEIDISANEKLLAFSCDSGLVGIIDLSTRQVTKMRTLHTNICGAVRFIPNRPSEILSAGYDSALLHFDITQGSILSRLDIAGIPPSSGISLSPPFIHSIAFSENGTVAASTADGRVWVGGGGDKLITPKKKRSRKWEGLREDEGKWISVAEGPLVSVDFADSESFLTCTLLGSLSRYNASVGSTETGIVWSRDVKELKKANCMQSNRTYIVVGGFSNGGKGLAEVYGA